MIKKLTTTLVVITLIYACSNYEILSTLDQDLTTRLLTTAPNGSISDYILPESDDYANIPHSSFNPMTKEKVELGKLLFFETGLAQDAIHSIGKGTYSCGSCHVPSAGFLPGRKQGIADGGLGFGTSGENRTTFSNYEDHELDVQGARPLSMFNTTYVTNSTWSGKFGANFVNQGTENQWDKEEALHLNYMGMDGLETQNIEGLRLHRMVVNEQVVDQLGYRAMFDAAFGEMPIGERYSELTASFALSAYLRSLLTTEAPFQKWLKGEQEAMTEREKRGAILFFGKAGCYRCHQGASLSSNQFYALGVRDLYETVGVFNTDENDARNLGRGGFTGKAEDMHKFKVPQLYNLKDAQFYFHGSSKTNLWAVVEYFNDGIPENNNVPIENIAKEFHPLHLTTLEIDDLESFLKDALFDPNIERYLPEEVLSGNCFPNNDPLSQYDLGCRE